MNQRPILLSTFVHETYTPVEFITLSLEGTNLLGNDVYRYFGKQNVLPLGVRELARTVQGSVRFRF